MSTSANMERMAAASAALTSPKRVGRIIGVLLLVHLAVALMVPFILLDRVRGSAGFLVNAAGSPGQVRVAVLMLLAGSAVAIGIAITAMPVFRSYSSAMGLWLLAIAVAAFTLQAVDCGAVLSMLSLSQEYAKAGVGKAELFQALGVVAGSSRKWAHFIYLLVAVCWIFLLFALLYRFRMVPRALAGFGLVASLVQIMAVPLRAIFGYPPEMRLAMPLGPAYLVLAVWLMVKGFDERHRLFRAETDATELAGS